MRSLVVRIATVLTLALALVAGPSLTKDTALLEAAPVAVQQAVDAQVPEAQAGTCSNILGKTYCGSVCHASNSAVSRLTVYGGWPVRATTPRYSIARGTCAAFKDDDGFAVPGGRVASNVGAGMSGWKKYGPGNHKVYDTQKVTIRVH